MAGVIAAVGTEWVFVSVTCNIVVIVCLTTTVVVVSGSS